MKKSIILILAIVAVCSCGYKNDPVAQAIEKAAMAQYGDQPYTFRINSLEKVDSAVFRTEMDSRIGTFKAKIESNQVLYRKYVRTGYTVNADIKKQTLKNDSLILIKLNNLKGEMGAKLDEVAYYDYKFTATGKVGGKNFEMIECYATVTPDNEVLTLAPDQKSVHKGTGKVLPGYLDIVKTVAPEESEEE